MNSLTTARGTDSLVRIIGQRPAVINGHTGQSRVQSKDSYLDGQIHHKNTKKPTKPQQPRKFQLRVDNMQERDAALETQMSFYVEELEKVLQKGISSIPSQRELQEAIS